MAGFAPSGWLVECDGYRQDQLRNACARKLRCDFGFCAAHGIAATGAGGRGDAAESANVRGHETENPIRWVLAGAGDQRHGGAELWPARELGPESRGQKTAEGTKTAAKATTETGARATTETGAAAAARRAENAGRAAPGRKQGTTAETEGKAR